MTAPSSKLYTYISSGDLPAVRQFLETTLPHLQKEQQAPFCYHLDPQCDGLPCPLLTPRLLETAAKANQPTILAYIWDTFMSKESSSRIPWPTLRSAAILGSIPLGEVIHARDPACFQWTEPAAPHGTRGGDSQLLVALRHDRIAYIDYMLAHGADINASYTDRSPVRAAVQAASDDATSLRQIRFLIGRGARVAGTGALEAAAAAGWAEAVHLLLSVDDVDDDLGKAIATAEKYHQSRAVEILRNRQRANEKSE